MWINKNPDFSGKFMVKMTGRKSIQRRTKKVVAEGGCEPFCVLSVLWLPATFTLPQGDPAVWMSVTPYSVVQTTLVAVYFVDAFAGVRVPSWPLREE